MDRAGFFRNNEMLFSIHYEQFETSSFFTIKISRHHGNQFVNLIPIINPMDKYQDNDLQCLLNRQTVSFDLWGQSCNKIATDFQMYRDFIIKQTSDFDSQFKAKTLVGNWYEERCDPARPDNFHFYQQRKLGQGTAKPTLTEQSFQNSTSNWLNFQNPMPSETFKTEYKDNYLETEKQKRLSVLNPFITKKGELQKNQQALDQYRQKWTKSKNAYDCSRTSIGHAKK